MKLKRWTRGDGALAATIGVCIALFIAAILLPVALEQIYTASTTGWNAAIIPIFQILLPVLGIIAVVAKLYKGAGV